MTPPGGGINPGPKPEPPTASIGRVTIAKHVSLRKLRAKGLVTTVVLGQGTTAVRFTVYRRAGKRLRLVASIVRVHGRSGRYRVKLNARALGLTRRGLYRLKFVPGLSRSALDQSAARAVWIRVVG